MRSLCEGDKYSVFFFFPFFLDVKKTQKQTTKPKYQLHITYSMDCHK